MAHRWSSVEQNEEDHGAPTHHIETIDSDEEAERSQKELPECFEADDGRLGPIVFPWEAVAIGIGACFVGSGVRFHCFGVGG